MSAYTGYMGKVYSIDDSDGFSTAFTNEATTESGVTKIYQIDAASKRVWDINNGVTIAGYWAFQEFGLSTTSGASSGLATTTQYYFKLAIDGGGIVEYNITTGGTVTWADIVSLIDTAISAAGATCQFIDGDVRIHSDGVTASSDISLTAGTTGTSLFGQGNVPAVGSLQTVDWANIALDQSAHLGTGGVDYTTGRVQMNYTGFTSLTVTGKYCTAEAIGQLTDWSLTINIGNEETTTFGDTWKTTMPTTKDVACSINGFWNDDNWTDLQLRGIVYIKLYTDLSNTLGFAFFGSINDILSVTPGAVLREAIAITGTSNITYFTT